MQDDTVPPPDARALGYVTSAAERLENTEVQVQVAALQEQCERRGWQLTGVVHEAQETRGRILDRPAFSCAMGRLGRGDASVLLVNDLGGLCRSVADLGTVLALLDRMGARLVSLRPHIDTGTELGRSAARIVADVSAWERERRAERSRKAFAAARAKGALKPAISPELKRRIERMRSAGMTLQGIVDELNDAGVPTVRGGATWRPSSVQAAVGYKRPAQI